MEQKILFILILTPLLMFSQKALGYYIDYDDVSDSFKKRYFAKDNINYYPTHVGDFWQYFYYDYYEEELKYPTREIANDTLVNDVTYFGLYQTFANGYRSFMHYARYTKETGTIYVLDINDSDEDGILGEDLLGDSLFVNYGTSYQSFMDTDLPVCPVTHEVFDTLWYIMKNDTLLTRVVSYDIFANVFFTDKLGVTKILPEQSPSIDLLGAIIDGVQYGTIVDVEETETRPQGFALYQNYPNPFNPTTTIKYSIPANAGVETLHATSLRIYNILSEEIATLVNEKQSPGNYSVQFDASNLPSGVYFYTLRVGDFVATKKMIFLK